MIEIRKTSTKVVWIGLCLVALGGCAHLQDAKLDSSLNLDSYFPLKVGNCWTYVTWFQGQAQADMEVCIVRQEDGYFLDNRPQPSRWRIDGQGLRDGKTRYVLKAPVKVGIKWMSVADVRTVERYEIVEVGKQIRVPAGVFKDCVVVRMEVRITDVRSLVNQMIFSPGTGIVEVRTELTQGNKNVPQSLLQLKSYQSQS